MSSMLSQNSQQNTHEFGMESHNSKVNDHSHNEEQIEDESYQNQFLQPHSISSIASHQKISLRNGTLQIKNQSIIQEERNKTEKKINEEIQNEIKQKLNNSNQFEINESKGTENEKENLKRKLSIENIYKTDQPKLKEQENLFDVEDEGGDQSCVEPTPQQIEAIKQRQIQRKQNQERQKREKQNAENLFEVEDEGPTPQQIKANRQSYLVKRQNFQNKKNEKLIAENEFGEIEEDQSCIQLTPQQFQAMRQRLMEQNQDQERQKSDKYNEISSESNFPAAKKIQIENNFENQLVQKMTEEQQAPQHSVQNQSMQQLQQKLKNSKEKLKKPKEEEKDLKEREESQVMKFVNKNEDVDFEFDEQISNNSINIQSKIKENSLLPQKHYQLEKNISKDQNIDHQKQNSSEKSSQLEEEFKEQIKQQKLEKQFFENHQPQQMQTYCLQKQWEQRSQQLISEATSKNNKSDIKIKNEEELILKMKQLESNDSKMSSLKGSQVISNSSERKIKEIHYGKMQINTHAEVLLNTNKKHLNNNVSSNKKIIEKEKALKIEQDEEACLSPNIKKTKNQLEKLSKLKEMKELEKKRIEIKLQKVQKELAFINHKEIQYQELQEYQNQKNHLIYNHEQKELQFQDQERQEPIQNAAKISVNNAMKNKQQKNKNIYKNSVKNNKKSQYLMINPRKNQGEDNTEFQNVDKKINTYLDSLNKIRQENQEKQKEKKKIQIMQRMKKQQMRKLQEKKLNNANLYYVQQFNSSKNEEINFEEQEKKIPSNKSINKNIAGVLKKVQSPSREGDKNDRIILDNIKIKTPLISSNKRLQKKLGSLPQGEIKEMEVMSSNKIEKGANKIKRNVGSEAYEMKLN